MLPFYVLFWGTVKQENNCITKILHNPHVYLTCFAVIATTEAPSLLRERHRELHSQSRVSISEFFSPHSLKKQSVLKQMLA